MQGYGRSKGQSEVKWSPSNHPTTASSSIITFTTAMITLIALALHSTHTTHHKRIILCVCRGQPGFLDKRLITSQVTGKRFGYLEFDSEEAATAAQQVG